MIARNATIENLQQALTAVNSKYAGNVTFNRIEQKTRNAVQFTLRVVSSHGKGARLSQSVNRNGNRKHMTAACWHVHGHFFEELLAVAPRAVITTGYDPTTGRKLRITADGGNWQDRNIGSQAYPLMYSDACECGPHMTYRNLATAEVRMIPQSSLTADCWSVQFRGLSACDGCEYNGTNECGGGATLAAMKQAAGK